VVSRAAWDPIAGILTMLLEYFELLTEPDQRSVRAALAAVVDAQLPSGNIPACIGDSTAETCHWCHGGPGLPALALAAARVQTCADEADRLSAAASRCGVLIWERGLLRKGSGLCHGVAGNGYAFVTLWRLTGDETHLCRAMGFASMLYNSDLLAAAADYHDPQRAVVGVPDSPCSLMEGTAGVICFLLDMLSPATARFPAWEV
jgi:hypothetical protein